MDNRHVVDRIDGYLDGEFDLAAGLEIERHLQGCPACRTAYEERRALSQRIQAQAVRYRPPAHLAAAVLQQIQAEPARLSLRRGLPLNWMAAAAVLLVAIGIGAGVTSWMHNPGAEDALVRQVAAAHTRSLLVDTHRADVASSDARTVQPWFAGKLDYVPPVKDWRTDGFTLAGGRIDYVDDRPVAALIYRKGQHVISLYLWPATAATPRDHRTAMHHGVNLLWWREGDLQYWLASDADPSDLLAFHHRIEARRAGPPQG